MTYLAIKKVKGRYYAYRQESYREGGQVRTRTIEYLGAIEPAVAKQVQATKKQAGRIQIDALVELIRANIDQSATPEALRATKPVPASPAPHKTNKSPPESTREADRFQQMQVNNEPALVDMKTGELIKTYSKVITTETGKEKPLRPFSESLKLPDSFAKYGVSTTALLRTHARYRQRLKDMKINPALMSNITVKYGHPDSLKRNNDGSITIFASRKTKNKRYPINKTTLWKNYRQALSSAYLQAIETGQPKTYRDLEVGLNYYHKQSKRLLFDYINLSNSPISRLALSLQFMIWDKIPKSIRENEKPKSIWKKANSKSVRKKQKPEDFGHVDFSTINDWQAETCFILSEVQKSGWGGLSERNAKARQKFKSGITRKLNQLKNVSFLKRVSHALSGKKRRILREILALEKRLKAVENLDDRLLTIRQTIPF